MENLEIDQAGDEIISALEQNETSDGTTVKKFLERGKVIAVTKDTVAFEVKRHRGAGSHYQPGMPMAAYQTYLAQYTLDRGSGEISLDSEKSVSIDYNVSALAKEKMDIDLFSLSIEEKGKGKYLISEDVSKKSSVIKTSKEAEDFAESIVEDDAMEMLFPEIVESLGGNEFTTFISELKAEMAKIARYEARREWGRRDQD